MSDDPIENSIGRSGKYQAWLTFLILFARISTIIQFNNVVFILPDVEYICLDDNANNATNYCPCQNPDYDRSTIASSVTTEWNLICERKHLASLAQSMLHFGMLFGNLIFGHISDRYGRKIGVITAIFTAVLFTASSALVPDFWMFLVFRFLIGASGGGASLCCYALIMEFCGKSFRPYMLGIYDIGYTCGYVIVPIIAYFVRNWRTFQLVVSVPWLFVIIYIWLITESPRWLITVGKKTEAIESLTRIAKKNNRPVEDIMYYVNKAEKQTLEEVQRRGSYLDLFKTRKIATYTAISSIIWVACVFVYNGITQYIGRLQGNIYLNVILSALSLIVTTIFDVIATLHVKRRTTIISAFVIAGLSSLLFILVPSDMVWLSVVFAITCLMGIFSTFSQLYLFTVEIFPTIVRSSAMGFASVCGRFGGFAAPFVVNLEMEWITFLTFTIVSFAAGLFCCVLPETKDIVLPNLIEQIEQTTKSKENVTDE